MRHAHSIPNGSIVWLGVLILAAAAGCGLLLAQPAQAATKSVTWLRLDSDIAVQTNGDLRVTETCVVHFQGGPFTFGYRDIDMSRLMDVVDVRVADAGGTLAHEISTRRGNIRRITYYFDPAMNEQRVVTLTYTAVGATRYYEDRAEVYWAAVYADRNGYAVKDARITVRLPEGVPARRVQTFGPAASLAGQGESVVTAVAREPIPSGRQFEIWVQLPPGVLTGFRPSWQEAYDQQAEYERTAKPAVDLAVLLIGLLVATGSVSVAVALWYRRGRDPQVSWTAEYLTAPPPGMAPGLAGTLVDETADIRDILATLVDLARRGVLVLREAEKQGWVFTGRDWIFAQGEHFASGLAPHEQALVQALGLDERAEVALSGFKNVFYKRMPAIQSALYDQVVAAGYYARRPDRARLPYQVLGAALLAVGMVVTVLMMVLAQEVVGTGIVLGLGLDAAGAAFVMAARGMAVRTAKGAEARARVEAFRRYLQAVDRYTDVKAAIDQFDRYLPYAIALGVERTWVRAFALTDAPAPGWYVPIGSFGRHSSGGMGQPATTVQGANASISHSLAAMNAGLTAMFSSVATTLSSHPSSGGRGGGSSGGGGGGFG